MFARDVGVTSRYLGNEVSVRCVETDICVSIGSMPWSRQKYLGRGSPTATSSIERSGRAGRALDIISQIAEVLDHIHANGIIHGDIKLENVMLVTEADGPRRRQVVKLLDFGLAERMGTRPVQLGGTPEYVAPERVEGGPPTEQTDIYALGVLAFRLLTGAFPFEGNVEDQLRAHLEVTPPRMSKLRGEELDEAVETLVGRALAKRPAERHASASAFRYELNAVMDMLAMSRRRTRTGAMRSESRREAMINVLFDKSRVRASGRPEDRQHRNRERRIHGALRRQRRRERRAGLTRVRAPCVCVSGVVPAPTGRHDVRFVPFVGETVHVFVMPPAAGS